MIIILGETEKKSNSSDHCIDAIKKIFQYALDGDFITAGEFVFNPWDVSRRSSAAKISRNIDG